MSIFGKEVDENVEKSGNEWIKASEFEQSPVLKFKEVSKIKSSYGATGKDSIVEKGILEEGESFRFVFEDAAGVTRKHDSASMPLFIGFHQAEINEGDWLQIKREGVKDKTRYYVSVVEGPSETVTKPVSQAKKFEYPKDDLGGESPF